MFRGVRGAITVKENNEQVIFQATDRLFKKIIHDNQIEPEQVASVFISVTDDITEAFPAKVLRSMEGWSYVPVICMKEITVRSALDKCIRVMMHINTSKSQQEINHVYLEDAVTLRPDLVPKNQ
jgi:chorismate mutase